MRRKRTERIWAAVLIVLNVFYQLPVAQLAVKAAPPSNYLVHIEEKDSAGNYTKFPDEAFRKRILEVEAQAAVGNGDGYLTVAEWQKWPTVLDLSWTDNGSQPAPITDLTGIKYFTGLKELDISGNQIKRAYLNQLPKLEVLKAAGNQLTDLTLDQCSQLTALDVSNNKLTELNIYSTELELLDFSGNQISNQVLTEHPKLKVLKAAKNGMDALDLSANTALEVLEVQGNELAALTISGNTALKECNGADNQLEEVSISANTNLEVLDITNNRIRTLDSGDLTKLITLKCENNQLEQLDISKSQGLTTLYAADNKLPYIRVFDQGSQLSDVRLGSQNVIVDASGDSAAGGRKVSLGFPDAGAVVESGVTGIGGTVSYRAQDMAFVFTDILSGFTYSYKFPQGPDVVMTVTASLAGLPVNALSFPDAAFRSYVSTRMDTDGSGYLSEAEIDTVTRIELSDQGVKEMTGLEHFKNLEHLEVKGNSLTGLSIAANTKLKVLDVSANAITSLVISKNTALTEIDCSNNRLKTVNLTNQRELKKFAAAGNSLTELELADNPKLEELNLSENQLADLDLSQNGSLKTLAVSQNQLTELDVLANPLLVNLSCGGNHLAYLKIANGGQSLTGTVDLGSQQTDGVPIGHNGGRYIDMGLLTYAAFAGVAAEYTDRVSMSEPDLTGKFFFTDLLSEFTYEYTLAAHKMTVRVEVTEAAIIEDLFPDAAFRSYLSGATIDLNQNGYLDENEMAGVKAIAAAGLGIADMTGMEKFTQLETLDVSDNELTELDLSRNPALTTVKAGQNQLTDGTLSGYQSLSLTELCVNDNDFTTFDVSTNTALQKLDVSGNALSQIQLNKNKSLTELRVSNNQLEELSLTANTALTIVAADQNRLTALDLAKNIKLKEVNISENQLTEINLRKSTALVQLDVSQNQLKALSLDEKFTALSVLKLAGNQITTLNLAPLNQLTVLDISGNGYRTLDLAGNTMLEELYVSDNRLEILDISMLSGLRILKCSNNSLAALDLRNQTATLTTLWCEENRLPYLTGIGAVTVDLKLGAQQVIGRATAKADAPEIWEIRMTDMPQAQRETVTELEANGNPVEFDGTEAIFSVQAQLPEFSYQISINGVVMEVAFSALAVNIEDEFPDEQFRAFVGAADIDSDQNGYLGEAELEAVKSMDIKGLQIESLAGIGYFTELVKLDCSFNKLTELDTSGNQKLEVLDARNNQLTTLDMSQNPSLIKLYISDNELVEFSTKGCSLLHFLSCENNALTKLEFGENLQLAYLNCSQNKLENLAVSGFKQLTELHCFGNQLTALDLVRNTKLEQLDAGNNQLAVINLAQSAPLKKVWLAENVLTEVKIDGFVQLTELDLSQNALDQLVLTGDTELIRLRAAGNRLTELDLSESVKLNELDLSENQLTELSLQTAPLLIQVSADHNQLTALEVSGLADLEVLSVSENSLTDLDVSANTKMKELYCLRNALTDLDLTQLPELMALQCGENHLREMKLPEPFAAGNPKIEFGVQRIPGVIERSSDETVWQIQVGLDQAVREQVTVEPAEGSYDPETDVLSFAEVKEKIPFTLVKEGYRMQVEVMDEAYEALLPVVERLVITPAGAIQVKQGGEMTFQTELSGRNYPDTGVNWKVNGATDKTTYVSQQGILKVGENEAAKTLTVTAVSAVDAKVSATVTVTVVSLAAKVTSVNLSSSRTGVRTSKIYLPKGKKQSLYATVSGSNLTDTTVQWSVSGNKNAKTKISSSGVLTLSSAEKATSIRVTAAAKQDPSKKATITVYVRTAPPKKGKTISYKKGQYKVTKAAKLAGSGYTIGEVTFTKYKNKKAAAVKIPDTVKVNGITYQVTAIKEKAFKNNKRLTTVSIGCYVKKIGKEAFYGCTKLKNLRIISTKLTAKSLGKKAFGKNKKNIKVMAPAKKLKSYKKLLKKAGIPKSAAYSSK